MKKFIFGFFSGVGLMVTLQVKKSFVSIVEKARQNPEDPNSQSINESMDTIREGVAYFKGEIRSAKVVRRVKGTVWKIRHRKMLAENRRQFDEVIADYFAGKST